jgi:AraC family transcriptional regulator
LAKIAVEFEPISRFRALGHAPGQLASRVLARGDGWSVSDLICRAGPHDRPFEEQHSGACIAIVTAGSFQYRSSTGRALMTPGSLLLGNAGQYFACGHEHGVGDRCISFSYESQYLERLAAEAEVGSACFSTLRVPPVREFSGLVARASARVAGSRSTTPDCEQSTLISESEKRTRNSLEHASSSGPGMTDWEEIGFELAARALEFAGSDEPNRGTFPAAEARVTRIVRLIENHPDVEHGLGALAREAKLSRYHFLRIFQQLAGLTPHQYLLRARLRRAAIRLLREPARVLDIALDSGFGDVSNFNHAFRAEFGVSPRSYRQNARPRLSGV